MIHLTLTLKITTAKVVKTTVTVNNSPMQDYAHPDGHAPPFYVMTPVDYFFKLRVTLTRLLLDYHCRRGDGVRFWSPPVWQLVAGDCSWCWLRVTELSKNWDKRSLAVARKIILTSYCEWRCLPKDQCLSLDDQQIAAGYGMLNVTYVDIAHLTCWTKPVVGSDSFLLNKFQLAERRQSVNPVGNSGTYIQFLLIHRAAK